MTCEDLPDQHQDKDISKQVRWNRYPEQSKLFIDMINLTFV